MTDTDRSFGAVVFSSDLRNGERRFLLVHHASGNHWDHPKGHPELGESPMETARREISEETGITVDFIDGFSVEASWTLPDGRNKIVRYFLARRRDGEGYDKDDVSGETGGEILGNLWLNYAECRRKLTYDTGKEVLDRAEEFISTAS